jgi:hypothetical protein
MIERHNAAFDIYMRLSEEAKDKDPVQALRYIGLALEENNAAKLALEFAARLINDVKRGDQN